MKFIYKAVLTAVVLAASAVPVAAQTLTTTYATDNSFAGNTFDLTPNQSVRINSFDVHLGSPGATATVAVYWRPGTSNGFQDSSAGWTLLGTANVVSNGPGVGTPLPVGGLTVRAGQTYGIYIDVQSYPSAAMLYTNGSNVFSNSDLSLRTFYGKGSPAFTGQTFNPRQWNGAIHYGPAFTTCAAEGLTGGKLTLCRKICEVDQTPTALSGLIKLYRAAYRENPPCAN
jgi:hypothetical protein